MYHLLQYLKVMFFAHSAEHVAPSWERRSVYRVLWGNLTERDHLGDPGVDGRIILRWFFRK